jgi:hypothetical protein
MKRVVDEVGVDIESMIDDPLRRGGEIAKGRAGEGSGQLWAIT